YLKLLPLDDFPELHPPGGITKAAFSRDGRYLAAGNLDGIVKIWDAQTGAEVHTLPRHGRFVRGLAFSPDGRLLAVGCEDEAGMVKIWDLKTGRFRDLPGHKGAVIGLAFSPDGSILASACLDGNVRLWDAASGRLLPPLHEKVVARDGLAFRPDGRLLMASE